MFFKDKTLDITSGSPPNPIKELYYEFLFLSDTADTDPGSGSYKFNNADPSLATFMFISNLQGGGLDISSLLKNLGLNTEINNVQKDDRDKALLFEVNSLIVDGITYQKIPISLLDSTFGLVFDNEEVIRLNFDQSNSLNNRINLEASSKILSGGLVSIDAPGVPAGESFSVESGLVRIITTSGKIDIPFGPFDAQVYTEAGEVAFLFINSGGVLVQRDTPTPQDFRTALLGIIARDAVGQLTAAFKIEVTAYQTWAQFSDLGRFLSGAASNAMRISPDIADTSFKRFAGTGFVFFGGILSDVDNPHIVSMDELTPTTFKTYLFDGTIESVIYSGLGTDTLIDPTVFDNLSGALISVPGSNNAAQTIKVFWQPTIQEIRLIQGQIIYLSITDALNDLPNYFPTIPTNVSAGSVDLGGFIVTKGATDFTNTAQAVFFRASNVAGGGGGSVAQTLQETYQLSLQPQIVTTLALGSVQTKDGTADDTNAILEVLDQDDNVTLGVSGAGVNTAIGLETAITGVISMDGPITIFSTTSVDIPAGTGQVVNYYDDYRQATLTKVSWNESLSFTIPNLGVDAFTIIYVDINGVIQTQNTLFTDSDHRIKIILAETINLIQASEILFVVNGVRAVGTTAQSYFSLFEFDGDKFNGGEVAQTADTGTNGLMAISIDALKVFSPSINWHNSKTNPDIVSLVATDPTTFATMIRTGEIVFSGDTLISPLFYDLNGVLTAVSSAAGGIRSTIQYIFKLANGAVVTQLGQTEYNDFTTALTALDVDLRGYIIAPGLTEFGRPLAAIILTQNSVDLANEVTSSIENFSSPTTGGGGGAAPTLFTDLTDTPGVPGTENTSMTWDNVGNLQNTGLSHSESATCWFLQNNNVSATGTIALGFNTNFANSDTLRSTLLGQNTAVNLGDGNNDLTIVGRGALNGAIPDGGGLINIVGMGGSVWSSLTSGSNSTAIGNNSGNNITNAINSFILGGLNIANSTTTIFNCGFYGIQSLGPAGAVTNYLNFHQTMQMDLSTDTVTIGDVNNTKPADTHYSLHLMRTDKVFGLNSLDDTAQGLITPIESDFWHNSTSNVYNVFENSEIRKLLSIDSSGLENTIPSFDTNGFLQATSLTDVISTNLGWFLSNPGSTNTGAICIGQNVNTLDSTGTDIVIVGDNSGRNIGDSNSNISIFGRQNLDAVSASGVLGNVSLLGSDSLRVLGSGFGISVIGVSAGNALISASNLVMLGSSAGFTMSSAVNVGIYGAFVNGPAGAVTDYVNLHNTLQMNTSSDTVTIGDVNAIKPADTHYSLHLMGSNKVFGLNSLNDTAQGLITPIESDFWHNSTSNVYNVFENSEIRKLLSIGTSGAVNTVPIFDANGFLASSSLTSFSNGTCWFLNDTSILGTQSMALGFFTNNASSNTLGSTMVGTNCCNKLGNNNDFITIVGVQALNSTIADGVMFGITGVGRNIWSSLTSGSSSSAIGSSAGNGVISAVNSVIVGGLQSGVTSTDITSCGFYGVGSLGPAGAVSNYVNFHNLIQMRLGTGNVTIGDTANTLPGNGDLSLDLVSTTQTLGLNTITTVAEDAITPVDGTIHYNSDDNVYKGVEAGVVKTFVTTTGVQSSALPKGYISWPNGPVRTNNNVLTLQAPFDARDPTNSFNFEITVNKTASLIVDGVGGIATSQFPATANTLYHLRVLGDSTNANDDNVDFIEAGTSPALPSGYDKSLVLFPAVYVDSGSILSVSTFAVVGNSIRMYLGLSSTDSQILFGGGAIVATLIDASEFVAVGQKQIVSLFYNYTTASNANEFAALSINETLLNRTNRVKPGVATQTRGLIDVAVSDVATFNYLTTSASDQLDLSVNAVTSSMRFD